MKPAPTASWGTARSGRDGEIELLDCARCPQPCTELRAFLQDRPLGWIYEQGARARPHRLEEHLRQAAHTADAIASELCDRGLVSREEACLAVAGAAIHDLGHILETDDLGVSDDALQFERRHTHRLELWLRLQGQARLASVIRHSAPLVALDARAGRASLAQLIVAYADACTGSDGRQVTLEQRAADVERRHGQNPGWRGDLQRYYASLLQSFQAWLPDALSRFGDTVLPGAPGKNIVFVERCDGRYTAPVGAVRESSTVYHVCRTEVSSGWRAAVVCGAQDGTAPDAPAPCTIHYLNSSDAEACAALIEAQGLHEGMIVTSWQSLLESPRLPAHLARVLLLRSLRRARDNAGFIARIARAREQGKIDRVVVVGPGLRDRLAEQGIPSLVIPNGCDPALFAPGGRPRKRQVLFVGAPIENKGIHLLLQAAPGLAELGVEVVIAGEREIYGAFGSHSARLEGSPANVRAVGFTPYAELPRLYEESLATIIPTDPGAMFEGFSKVALESLRMGTPIIASRCGNLPYWVEPGATGWLIEPYDPRVLVDIVSRNLPALAAGELSGPCRARAAGHTWERTAWELDRLYDDLQLERQSRRGEERPAPERFQALLAARYPGLTEIERPPIPTGREPRRGTILAVEPHPDDVAYGCSLELLERWIEGYDVLVLSAFSAAALATFRYIDKMPVTRGEFREIREAENLAALARYLPFQVRHLGLPTASGRGYERAFGQVRADDPGRGAILDALRSLGEEPAMIYAPAGFGRHADHLLLRDVTLEVFGDRVHLYEEPPYVHDDPGRVEELRAEGWQRRLGQPVDDAALAVKVAVVSHFCSQLPVRSGIELHSYVANWIRHEPRVLEAFWGRP